MGAHVRMTEVVWDSAIPQDPETSANQEQEPQADVLPELADDEVPQLSLEIIEARRTSIESQGDLDAVTKTEALRRFDRALELIKHHADIESQITAQKLAAEQAPQQIEEIRRQLDEPAMGSQPQFPSTSTLAELESMRATDVERLNEAIRRLEDWNTRAALRTERRPQLPESIEQAKVQLDEARQTLKAAPPAGEDPTLRLAARTEQEALVVLLTTQLEQLRTEQTQYESRSELYPLQRDLLVRNQNVLNRRIENWQRIIADARSQESERLQAIARQLTENLDPRLSKLAEEFQLLIENLTELQNRRKTWEAELTEVQLQLQQIDQKFRDVSETIERVGLSIGAGTILRNERNQLPAWRKYSQMRRSAELDIVELQSEQTEIDLKRRSLSDLELNVDDFIAQIEAKAARSEIDLTDITLDDLRQMARQQYAELRNQLDSSLNAHESALLTLTNLEFSARTLSGRIREFESYIDERVLWIRSIQPINAKFPLKAWNHCREVFVYAEWPLLATRFLNDLSQHWLIYLLFVVLSANVFLLRIRMKGIVARLKQSIRSPLDSAVPQTLLGIALSFIAALDWPILFWFASWRLSFFDINPAQAFSAALFYSGNLLWLLNSFLEFCRSAHVAESLLNWPTSTVQRLCHTTKRYILFGVPTSFIMVFAAKLGDGATTETIGRVALLGLCFVLMYVAKRILNPRGPVVSNFVREHPKSRLYKLRMVWYPIALGLPLVIAVLSLRGYQHTAEQLLVRLELSLGLLVVLAIFYSLLMRWSLSVRRILSLKQMRAKREADLAAVEKKTGDDEISAIQIPSEATEIDPTILRQQVIRFVQGTVLIAFLIGSWAIWFQVLPALQGFSRIELWSNVVVANEVIDLAGEGPKIREFTRIQVVTLGHVLLALAILAIAAHASVNVPGLLEFSILQRLPIDHGSRNAIKLLTKYALFVTGLVVASNLIGLRWNTIQWLVAALSVGLGFGLQEIFANFVSGLIILFERPVRIGDVVTIDGVTGKVSRIQIRATTITDWDRREYIVPNKEFVTGRLLNWSLSDETTRLVLPVGVAYGTNLPLAIHTLQQIADEHPLVLKDPAPLVSFEEFADSSLQLTLRCFLPNLDQRIKTITEINLAINQRFADAGIEIAFPQRDLHIRSISPNAAASLKNA
ncbi:MAG TPA: mechanosensitive ion channel [Pirellulaceae bacterium]|nr:mechanosensitive ion channel [Pirellulaceae bacterium]